MKKFRDYLVEISVIVIGITLSFMVDEWRNSNKRRAQEKEILRDLKFGLEKDLIDIERCGIIFNNQITKIDSVLLLMENVNMDESFPRLVSQSLFSTIFQAQRGIYDDLKTKGISIISEKSLRESIITLFDRIYRIPDSQDEIYIDQLRLQIMMYSFENFDSYGPYVGKNGYTAFSSDVMYPLDYTDLRASPVFKSLLNSYRKALTVKVTGTNIVKSNIENVIELIVDELE